ncbi:MAG: nucleotidyltransferase family protein [Chloroflexi bacterium]|nr:nucleotidyltransferase family protein [Chloroflexota bacterium]
MADKTAIKVPVPEQAIADFCRKHHIRRLAFFGSVLRDDFRPDSDIDVLVEFEPGQVPGFFGLVGMEEELTVLFGGRKVDLRTPGELSRYFRQKVLDSAVAVYDAA